MAPHLAYATGSGVISPDIENRSHQMYSTNHHTAAIRRNDRHFYHTYHQQMLQQNLFYQQNNYVFNIT